MKEFTLIDVFISYHYLEVAKTQTLWFVVTFYSLFSVMKISPYSQNPCLDKLVYTGKFKRPPHVFYTYELQFHC